MRITWVHECFGGAVKVCDVVVFVRKRREDFEVSKSAKSKLISGVRDIRVWRVPGFFPVPTFVG